MATINTITDQYIIQASVDDKASAGIEKLSVRLGAYETAARSAMSAAEKMADTTANGGVKFEVAAAQFDRFAKKYDDVTAAAARLAAAERELEQAVITGQRAVAGGTATQEAFQATTAGLAEKIAGLATTLGNKRAEMVADQAATEAWNGSIGRAGELAGAFAQQVAAAAQTTRADILTKAALTAQIEAYNAATVKATESQRLWNATSGVIIDPEARTAARQADMDALSKSILEQRAALIPLIATSKQYSDAWEELSAAVKVGLISQEEATIQQTALTAAFSAANQPLADYNAQLAQTAAQAKATAAEQASAASRLETLAQKYDPLYRAQARYAASIKEINELELEGKLAYDVAAQARTRETDQLTTATTPAITKVTDAHAKMTAQQNLQTFATRQLGVQTVQFFSSIQGGTPIMLAIVQQGHQLIDVALATGTGFEVVTNAIKSTWNALAAFTIANPAIVALGAFSAVVALLTYNAESARERMIALQNTLRATRDDFTAMAVTATTAARAVSATQNITLTDAKTGAAAISASSNFTGTNAQLQALIVTAANLKAITGTTFEQFAAGLDHVGQFAQTLADKQLPGMTQAMARSIALMEQGGNTAGAYAKMLSIINEATKGAIDNQTDLQKALLNLSKAFNDAGTTGQSFGGILASFGSALAVAMLEKLTTTMKELKAIWDFFSKLKLPDWVSSSQTAQVASDSASGAALPSTFQALPTLPKGSPTPFAQQVIAGAVSGGMISSQEGAFATNVAMAESGGHQFDPKTGKVVTSSAGALGQFQLMPGTAARLHVDATKEDENVQGGLAYIHQLWTDPDFGGDPQLIAMAYNWGPENAKKFIKGVKTLGEVPTETKNFVAKVTGSALTSATAANAGVGISAQKQIDTSVADADKAGASASKFEAASTKVKEFTASLKLLEDQGKGNSIEANKLNEMLNQAVVDMVGAVPAVQALLIADEKQIAANDNLAEAYGRGGAAVAQMTAHNQAVLDLYGKLDPSSKDYTETLKNMTAENIRVAASAEKITAAQEQHSLDNSITMVKAETQTLGMNSNARSLLLTHMQNELQLRDTYKASYDTVGVKMLAERDRLAALTLSYQNTQASLSYVSGQFTQAFDTIGNAMTQAFVQGKNSAVSWGSVMSSVVQQVIQQFLKLAVLNPILNSLFGQNNPTLSSVSAALGTISNNQANGFSTGSSGSSLLGTGASLLSTGSSISGAFGGPTLLSSLGITGPGGLVSNLGLDGIGSSVSGFLGTPILGGVAANTSAEAAAIPLAGDAASGATIGSFAGGVGLGYGAGSLTGGLLQGALGKVGPAPQIGAATGAIAGAIIGSFIPVVGTLLGGLIGGMIGGGGGGLIGPQAMSMYSSQGISVNNGQFATGRFLSQIDPNSAAEEAAVVSDTNNLNAFMAANSVLLTSLGKITQLGDNTPGKEEDPTKAANINAAFPNFRFSSSDPIMADKLLDKSFGSADEFQKWVTTFTQVQAATKAYLTDTAAVLKDLGAVSGSLPDSIKQISAAYDVDKTNMDALIASGDLSEQQTIDLTKAEGDLATIRDRSLQQLQDATAAHYATIDAGLTERQLAVTAAQSGNAYDQLNAQLYQFDTNAPDQRASLKADLIGIYGDAVVTSEGYAAQMALLETTLTQERLGIVQNYTNQMKVLNDAVIANDNSLQGRDLAAQAALSKDPADLLKSQLYAFDTSAQTQRTALSKQLIDTYGATIVNTVNYTGRMATLEKVLGEERLEIATQASDALVAQQKAALDQARTAAASAIASLATWAAGLATSASSPLSPLLKLQSAQSAFDDNSAKAKAGDASAVGTLQTTGSTLLAAAQSYYGSSTGYTAIFNNVVTALQNLAATSPDTLTASFLALQTQTQTQTLVDALAALQAEVARLRADVNRNSAAPARLAA